VCPWVELVHTSSCMMGPQFANWGFVWLRCVARSGRSSFLFVLSYNVVNNWGLLKRLIIMSNKGNEPLSLPTDPPRSREVAPWRIANKTRPLHPWPGDENFWGLHPTSVDSDYEGIQSGKLNPPLSYCLNLQQSKYSISLYHPIS